MSNKKSESKPKEKKEFDLYANKRKIQKEVRKIKNQILGTDTVDGSTFQRFYGEATKTRRALKIEMFGSKSKSSKYGDDTSIEKFIENILIEEEIEFKKQKAIRYINVDVYLPGQNIVLQLHGTYWHCDPRVYSVPKNNMQKKNIEKDHVAKKIILEGEYKLLEIWEDDIKKRPDLVRAKMLQLIADENATFPATSLDW